MSKPKSIFVTRSIQDLPLLKVYCEAQDINLTARSLIAFSAVDTEIPVDMEVLFLGSGQAMKYFLMAAENQAKRGNSIDWNFKIACIGEATAKQIRKLGFEVDFAGTKSSDPLSVAKELEIWLDKRKLHIALSAQSNQSMSGYLPKGQTIEFVVYETIAEPVKFEQTFDLIAFSSPSNLDSFLISNAISPETKLIAWGKTTEKKLNQSNYSADYLLENGLESELIAILELIRRGIM